jgi:histidinol-phosphate aminotransferase
MSYFRDNIEAMTAYVPGAPADEPDVIKLNQNENPYPPSPKALEAMRQFAGESLRFYPDPLATKFCEAAAQVLGVDPQRILVGDGSDDLIIMIARAALGKGRKLVITDPTFPYYFTQGLVEDAQILSVPAREDFSLPIEEMAAANGDVTFIAAPNSPTGACAALEKLNWLARQVKGLLVIDEAYVDFAAASALPLMERLPNVIILRTLSKSYSLAGLRLGFAVLNAQLKDGLLKTKSIYNVGPLPAAIGAAAMADQAYHRQCVGKIVAERGRLAEALAQRAYTVWPSAANFLMVSPPGGDADAVYHSLKARRVLVRYFPTQRMRDKLRISIGTPQENDALLERL